ncbi:MAG: hypothetical protein OEW17_05650 [Gemmatimonadota bacterium]|nr:hypothetical protein [Gemmatimonadota bacterium]
MTDQPRDWDKELAAIDRVMARSPEKAGGALPAEAPGRVPAAAGRFGALGTWLRVLLGAALAIGITQWPYPSACGVNLMVYGTTIMLVIVAGTWSALSSWRRHLGLAHLISLAVLFWGLVLAAREVLPRVGYARDARTWVCATSLESR